MDIEMESFLFKKGPGKASEPLESQTLFGGENDEVQEHTDGNDAGSTKTDTSAS